MGRQWLTGIEGSLTFSLCVNPVIILELTEKKNYKNLARSSEAIKYFQCFWNQDTPTTHLQTHPQLPLQCGHVFDS